MDNMLSEIYDLLEKNAYNQSGVKIAASMRYFTTCPK